MHPKFEKKLEIVRSDNLWKTAEKGSGKKERSLKVAI